VNCEAPPKIWPVGTLLAQLSRHECEQLLRLGIRREVDPGTILLRQGDRNADVILIHRGVTKVTHVTADGRNTLLAIRAAGEMVGEMAALNGHPRSATVTTCGRCTYSLVRSHEFHTFLAGHPGTTVQIASMVAARLRVANEFRIDFASYHAQVRVARAIVKLAQQYGYQARSGGLVIDVPLTQTELASICGAAKITVEKILYEFRRRGLVETGYRRIVVLDPPGLRVAGQL
jgi:CRP/FNR family cyclic AMP-dependent transcriptional regulator